MPKRWSGWKGSTLVVDKTNTLTEGGKPKVTHRGCVGFDENEVLRLAASVERAENIRSPPRSWWPPRGKRMTLARPCDSPVGKGVIGMVEQRRVLLGNAKF